MKNRLSTQIRLIFALFLVFVLVSCGGSESPGTPELPPDVEPAGSSEGPGEENVITYIFPRTISQLDPSLVLSSETNIMWNVYGNLTFWDPDEGVLPMLAEDWESNEDATEWTFRLREGLTCHDGTEFTAEAVKFSFERTIEQGALAYVFASVDRIEVVDDLTVRIHCNYPVRLPALLANNWGTFMMCPGVEGKPPEWFNEGNEIGVGPYTIESYEPGQRIVLSAFEDWYAGWDQNQFDKVIIEIVEEPDERVQMVLNGEGDLTWHTPFDDFEVLNAAEGVTALAIPAYQQLQWHLNTRRAPLDDVRVRQALAHAFPYETAAQETFGGFATVAEGAVPRVQWQPSAETETYGYDLDRAQELLDEAGVEEGTTLRLGVEVNQRDAVRVAQLWQAELAKLGIDMAVEKISGSDRWTEVYNPDTEYDIMILHMQIGFNSPSEYLGSVWHSEWTWYPFSGFESTEFDALVEEALATEAVDRNQSDSLYQEAEQILYDEAVAVFALDLPQDWTISNDIVGFKPNPLYGYTAFLWQMGLK